MSKGLSRYGLLNHRSGFQRVMHHYSDYVKLWLRFNNISTLTDLSGNSNNLSASGSPVITEANYIDLGRPAVTFDGATDYYSITDANQTGLDLNGAEILDDPGLESWTGDDPDDWTKTEAGGSTVTDEGVEKHGGSHAAKLTIDAGNAEASIKESKTVEPSTQYTFEVWRKHSAAVHTAKVVIKNTTTNNYLQADGTWAATAGFEIANVVAWTKYVFPGQFITESSGTTLEVKVMNGTAASSSIYVDDISLTKCYDAVILAVFKSTTDVTAKRPIVCKGDAGTGINYYLRVNNTTGVLRINLKDDTTVVGVNGSTTLNDNTWRVCQGNFDRGGQISIYINGSSEGSPASLTGVGNVDNAGSNYISCDHDSNLFVGSIAEVMMLTGAPLPAAILSANFASWVYNFSAKWPIEIPHNDGA